MLFEKAFGIILDWEGGYVNDPGDPGGETKFGISKRSYPNVKINELTREDAADIYKRDFWDACKCDEFPPPVAILLFDAAIQHGQETAIKMLQNVVNVSADGIVGRKTILTVNGKSPAYIARELSLSRMMLYTSNKNWSLYGKGWTRRLLDIYNKAFA